MALSFRDYIKNPELRRFLKDKWQFQRLTATAVKIEQNRLVEVASGEIQAGTDDDANILGATQEGSIASEGVGNIDFGIVEVLTSGKLEELDKVAGAASGRVRKFLASQGTINSAEKGEGFDNQPSGEKVKVVSDNADDDGSVTYYFTRTGATDVVATETVTVNGTTDVETEADDIEVVLAIVTDDTHSGTLTFTQGTSGGTITTIATGTASEGYYDDIDAEDAFGAIPIVKSDSTTTKWVGVIGTDVDGNAQTAAVELNNDSDVNLGTSAFDKVQKVLVGDVEAARDVILQTKDTDSNDVGIALEDKATGSIAKVYVAPYGI